MPKIKAYTSQGLIIPVSDAKISNAYQCPWTQNVFGTKQSYVKHLRVLRESMHRRARILVKAKKMQELWNMPTFDDIILWVGDNSKIVLDNVFENINKKNQDKFSIKITYLDIQWYNNVSNSHDCPHNGVTNWGRGDCFKDGTAKPTGYPGWHGRIEYKLSHSPRFSSEVLGNFRIHTGTGGGIGYGRYGFEVKFFDADWPGLHSYQNLAERYDSFKYGKPDYFK